MGWDADPVREGGEGGYRVRFRVRPRDISYRIFVIFLKNLGPVWETFGQFGDFLLILFGHVWECCGDLLGGTLGAIVASVS